MQLKDDTNGLEIELAYDEDGFPLINISLGGGFYAENFRPTVEINLEGVRIHEMFDNGEDQRWNESEVTPTSSSA